MFQIKAQKKTLISPFYDDMAKLFCIFSELYQRDIFVSVCGSVGTIFQQWGTDSAEQKEQQASIS